MRTDRVERFAPERARLLMIAFACAPEMGSECQVGWQRALGAAQVCDTWVICDPTFGHGFAAAGDTALYAEEQARTGGLHFHFLPRTRLEWFFFRLPGWFERLGYNLWHRRAYRLARRLHGELRFDLSHQATWCGYFEPGYLWKLGIPFIWGPIGGTQNYPWRFLARAGVSVAIREGLRSFLNYLCLRLEPRVRQAARRAVVLIAANSTVQRDFSRVHGVNPILILDTGARVTDTQDRLLRRDRPLRLLWSGVFHHNKALHLLIDALASLPKAVRWELRILGRGPWKERWMRRAERAGVMSRCTWMGWLPYPEAQEQYAWADLFVFTSLRDTSGTVNLEAMSHGLPILCFDHQGVADIVTAESGVKIPVTTPEKAVSGLAGAIAALAEDRDQLRALSSGARQRAAEFLWSRQAERIAALYRQVLSAYRKSPAVDQG